MPALEDRCNCNCPLCNPGLKGAVIHCGIYDNDCFHEKRQDDDNLLREDETLAGTGLFDPGFESSLSDGLGFFPGESNDEEEDSQEE